MDKEEIDKFFKTINAALKSYSFRDLTPILEGAMKKIDQGDFDYFCSKLKDDENEFIAVEMLKHTSKTEKLEDIIDNYEEYNINIDDLPELVEATKDGNYIIGILEDEEKRKCFNLEEDKLILAIEDEELLQNLLLDWNKVKRLGINARYIITEKYGDYNNFLKHLEKNNEIEDKGRKINLPEKMTIGIEIESEGKASFMILGTNKDFAPNWECKYDDSLNLGVEVVSPILTGDTVKSTEEIKYVCNRLNNLDQKISDRCGGHVHIGADFLTKKESLESLAELWGSCEKILYIISNKEGELPRNGVAEYAAPISGDLEELLKHESINLETKEDLREFAKKTQGFDGASINRYKGINFSNIGNEKNTIEFRLANGTLDQNTWIENINLFGGMIKASEDIGIIKSKINEGKELNLEEQEKLKHFEKLQDSELTEDQKLEEFLSLTIKEQDRDIYRGRYNINHKLLEKNQDLESEITKKISKSSIVFKKNQIGKAIFMGENAIDASDSQENDRIIAQYLNREKEKENQNKKQNEEETMEH